MGKNTFNSLSLIQSFGSLHFFSRTYRQCHSSFLLCVSHSLSPAVIYFLSWFFITFGLFLLCMPTVRILAMMWWWCTSAGVVVFMLGNILNFISFGYAAQVDFVKPFATE